MATAITMKEVRQPKRLPAPNSDFYQAITGLSAFAYQRDRRIAGFRHAKS